MVKAARSPALRACTVSAFVISGVDMGVFPLMGVPVFGRREILGERYPCVMFHPPMQPLLRCTTQLIFLRDMWSYA